MAKYRDLDTATITATTADGTTLSSVERAVTQKGLNLEQQHILGCFSGFRSNHFTRDTSCRHDLFNRQPYGKSMGRRYHTLTLKRPGTIQQVDCGHLGIYEIIRLDGEEPLVLRYYSTCIPEFLAIPPTIPAEVQEAVRKSTRGNRGEIMPQKIRSVQEILQVWRQAGQEKTRGEIAAYIADRQRQATEFEQRAWQLVGMWQETRSLETFFSMVVAHWAEATLALHEPADEWACAHERDEQTARTLLEWLGFSPILCCDTVTFQVASDLRGR